MSSHYESGFTVGRELPWHKLGKLIAPERKLSVPEALIDSGTNWDVYLRDSFVVGNDGVTLIATGERATMRKMLVDGKEVEQVLGTVGQRYVPLQNQKAFEWFQPFLDKNEAELHTAGSLYDGKIVWVLAKLNRDPIVIKNDDTVNKFLLLSNSHDGSRSVKVCLTPIRVVCANTLALAEKNKASKIIRIKHTKSVEVNLTNLRETVNAIDAEFEATAEQYKMLANRGINKNDLIKYVKIVLNGSEDVEVSSRQENLIMENIIPRFENEQQSLLGIQGTWWSAYNALTEYYTWDAGGDGENGKSSPLKKQNNRINSLWFGANGQKVQDALSIAVNLAG